MTRSTTAPDITVLLLSNLQQDVVTGEAVITRCNIFPQTITELINQLMNHEAVCRSAPATPGLINTKLFMHLVVGCTTSHSPP